MLLKMEPMKRVPDKVWNMSTIWNAAYEIGNSIENRLKRKGVGGREENANTISKVHLNSYYDMDLSSNCKQWEKPANGMMFTQIIEARSGNRVNLISECVHMCACLCIFHYYRKNIQKKLNMYRSLTVAHCFILYTDQFQAHMFDNMWLIVINFLNFSVTQGSFLV